jgi:gamma-D-glutamyl-L-lysine dipeptidyl-peptidase
MVEISKTKYNLKSVLFYCILFFIYGCSSPSVSNYQSVIDSIASRWVPDHRIEICNVTAKNSKNGTLVLSGETTNINAKQEIINTLNNRSIDLIDSIIMLPDTLVNDKYFGLVTISVSNLRKEPDHSSELVSQSIMGTPVRILKSVNSWLLIQTPDRYIAWTESSSVMQMNHSEMDNWKKSDRVIYIDKSGWIYDKDSDDSGVVGDIVAGCIMEMAGESENYAIVKLPDGRKGFINKNDVTDFDIFKNQGNLSGEKVIHTASSLLGVPYLWGGSSTKGVDCSGFVQNVYFMNGLILMRDASQQALHGEHVDISKSFSQLEKGDLLFFGSKGNSGSRVSHVAIYKGDNEYINASGRVIINSLDSASNNFSNYRLNSLLSARRVIGVDNGPGIVSIGKHAWY